MVYILGELPNMNTSGVAFNTPSFAVNPFSTKMQVPISKYFFPVVVGINIYTALFHV